MWFLWDESGRLEEASPRDRPGLSFADCWAPGVVSDTKASWFSEGEGSVSIDSGSGSAGGGGGGGMLGGFLDG